MSSCSRDSAIADRRLGAHQMHGHETLSDAVARGIRDIENNELELRHEHADHLCDRLRMLWNPGVAPPVCSRVRSTGEPSWVIGMTREFIRSTQGVAKDLQGRILTAIREIVVDPMSPKGDTVKPMIADRKGFWRFRIGDYRLVYLPNESTRIVTLIAFGRRGDIYKD